MLGTLILGLRRVYPDPVGAQLALSFEGLPRLRFQPLHPNNPSERPCTICTYKLEPLSYVIPKLFRMNTSKKSHKC
jgi:hypothetical protein